MDIISLSLLLWRNLKSKVESWSVNFICWFHCFLVIVGGEPHGPFLSTSHLWTFYFLQVPFLSSPTVFEVLVIFRFQKDSNIPCFLYILQSPDFTVFFLILFFFSYWVFEAADGEEERPLIQQVWGEVGHTPDNPLDIVRFLQKKPRSAHVTASFGPAVGVQHWVLFAFSIFHRTRIFFTHP